MADSSRGLEITTAACVRVLFVSGFKITGAETGTSQIEIRCERSDQLGNTVKYIIALTSLDAPPLVEIEALQHEAMNENRIVVPIARLPGANCLGWEDFLEALGGAIPSLRPFEPSYADVLITSSKNEDVPGINAQAWSIFEQAVADGLEFIFGLRVRRLGGIRRGRRVSDILAETPDQRILVVDAKASKNAYEVSTSTERQLTDYVKQAMTFQRGASPVGAAVVVAREFTQDEARLNDVAKEFLADTQVPLSFLPVELLLKMIAALRDNSEIRGAVRWKRIFCQGGLISKQQFEKELGEVRNQRINK